MQFSTGRFSAASSRHAGHAGPSRGIAAALQLLIYAAILAIAFAVLARNTGGPGLPSNQFLSQFLSQKQLTDNIASPTDVIDSFVAARSVDDVDAGAALFETDALITDSSGRSSSGTDAVRHLMVSLHGWEAGPRHATGHQVVWAESLPMWQLPAAPTELDFRLEQEVPHYAARQLMCADIRDSKIHTLVALPAGGPRTC